ncbi:MAG: TRAP transporter permease, partial [Pseudomonadota bacterium]
MATTETAIDAKTLEELEREYDSALRIRDNGPALSRFLYWATVVFAAYHLWTAGFGTPVDYVHMGIHLSGLYLFIFCSFPLLKKESAMQYRPIRWVRPGSVPLYDWITLTLAIAAALFLWVSWRGIDAFHLFIPEQMLRQGNPTGLDVFFGSVLVLSSLEIARRTIG